MYVSPQYIPQPEIPNAPLYIQDVAPDMEDDDQEEATEHEAGESSRLKRRHPVGRPSLFEIAAGISLGMPLNGIKCKNGMRMIRYGGPNSSPD